MAQSTRTHRMGAVAQEAVLAHLFRQKDSHLVARHSAWSIGLVPDPFPGRRGQREPKSLKIVRDDHEKARRGRR